MKKNLFLITSGLIMIFSGLGCASSQRGTSSVGRSGRSVKESKPMNHRTLNTDMLYEACLRERPEVSCRNRMGR